MGGTSFGAHESQSRLWGNHVVRNPDFWRLHFSELQQHFMQQLADVSAVDLYRAVMHVEPGLIRVEADEVTYDMHVMVRVEIECALMDGTLQVKDLTAVWNETLKRDLGVVVPDDSWGVLQDIHWSVGFVGSFPSYTIGNVMAAQLMDHLQTADPSLLSAMERGEYTQLADALRQQVWQLGRRYGRDELLIRSTGHALDIAPYLAYLDKKYARGEV